MAKKTEMIGFKTTPEIRSALEEIAAKNDRSLSYVINKILERALKISPDKSGETELKKDSTT